MSLYKVSLNVTQEIEADCEDDALEIFQNDLMDVWSQEEVCDITKLS